MRVFAEMHLYPGEAGLIEFDGLEPGEVYVVRMQGLDPLLIVNATIPADGSILSSDAVIVAFKAEGETAALLVRSTGDQNAWFTVYKGTRLLWWHNYTVAGMTMPGDIGVDSWDELDAALCLLSECTDTTVINGDTLLADRVLEVSITGYLADGLLDLSVPAGYSLVIEGALHNEVSDAIIDAKLGSGSTLSLRSLNIYNVIVNINGDGILMLDDSVGTLTLTAMNLAGIEVQSPMLGLTVASNDIVNISGTLESLRLTSPEVLVNGALTAYSVVVQPPPGSSTSLTGPGTLEAGSISIYSPGAANITNLELHVDNTGINADTVYIASATIATTSLSIKANSIEAYNASLKASKITLESSSTTITGSILNTDVITVIGKNRESNLYFDNTTLKSPARLESSMEARIKGTLILEGPQLELSRVFVGLSIHAGRPIVVAGDRVVGSLDLALTGTQGVLIFRDSVLSRLDTMLDGSRLTVIGGNITNLDSTVTGIVELNVIGDTDINEVDINVNDGSLRLLYAPSTRANLSTLSLSMPNGEITIRGLTLIDSGLSVYAYTESNIIMVNGDFTVTDSITVSGATTALGGINAHNSQIELLDDAEISATDSRIYNSDLAIIDGRISLYNTTLSSVKIHGIEGGYTISIDSPVSVLLEADAYSANGSIIGLTTPLNTALTRFHGSLDIYIGAVCVNVANASFLSIQANDSDLAVTGENATIEITAYTRINASISITDSKITFIGPGSTLSESRISNSTLIIDEGILTISSSLLDETTLHVSHGSSAELTDSRLLNPVIILEEASLALYNTNITGYRLLIQAENSSAGLIIDSRIAVDTLQGVNSPLLVIVDSSLSAIDCWGVATASIASQTSCTSGVIVNATSMIGPIEVTPGSLFKASYNGVSVQVAAGPKGALTIIAMDGDKLVPIVLGDGLLRVDSEYCNATVLLGSPQTSEAGCTIKAEAPVVAALASLAIGQEAVREPDTGTGLEDNPGSNGNDTTIIDYESSPHAPSPNATIADDIESSENVTSQRESIEQSLIGGGEERVNKAAIAATALILAVAVIIVAYMARSRSSGQGFI